jgi:hypothetical protein
MIHKVSCFNVELEHRSSMFLGGIVAYLQPSAGPFCLQDVFPRGRDWMEAKHRV